jgi:hypothetical protein
MNMNLLYCYLSGQHDFGVRCEPGEIYLRCIHCGRRSAGWALKGATQAASETAVTAAKREAKAGKRPARSAAPVVASV